MPLVPKFDVIYTHLIKCIPSRFFIVPHRKYKLSKSCHPPPSALSLNPSSLQGIRHSPFSYFFEEKRGKERGKKKEIIYIHRNNNKQVNIDVRQYFGWREFHLKISPPLERLNSIHFPPIHSVSMSFSFSLSFPLFLLRICLRK